jgi:hypothetical protein
MSNISTDEIRAEVKKFWDFFSRKSKSRFDEMYLPRQPSSRLTHGGSSRRG